MKSDVHDDQLEVQAGQEPDANQVRQLAAIKQPANDPVAQFERQPLVMAANPLFPIGPRPVAELRPILYTLTVVQIRDELRARNLPIYGAKAVILNRLVHRLDEEVRIQEHVE